jgi:hypothetical protein
MNVKAPVCIRITSDACAFFSGSKRQEPEKLDTLYIYFGPKSPGAGKNWLATGSGQKLVHPLPSLRPDEGVVHFVSPIRFNGRIS